MLNDDLIRINFIRKHIRGGGAIFHELAVKRGIAIADFVVVNKVAHCYEIKSDVDSLSRLKLQAEVFSDVFKKVTLITTPKHKERAELLVPSWWGIITAKESSKGVVFNHTRRCAINPQNTSENLLKILWNSELKSFLYFIGVDFKKNANRDELVSTVIENVTTKKINDFFVMKMKERVNL
jgi:hypothetical protein